MSRNPQSEALQGRYAENGGVKIHDVVGGQGLAGWVKDPAERSGYVDAFRRSSLAGMLNDYRANYPSGGDDAEALVNRTIRSWLADRR